jgi:hypothetical protein
VVLPSKLVEEVRSLGYEVNYTIIDGLIRMNLIEEGKEMKSVISADEAKIYSEENIKKIEEKELQNVMDCIKKAIDKGVFHITYDISLNNITVMALKRLGYRIECHQMDNQYTISWSQSPSSTKTNIGG